MYPVPTCQALLKAVTENGPWNSFTFSPMLCPPRYQPHPMGPCVENISESVSLISDTYWKDRSPRWWITTLSSAVEINSWPTKPPAGQPWKATLTLGDKLIQDPRCERVNPVDTLHQCSLQGVTQVISYTNIQTTTSLQNKQKQPNPTQRRICAQQQKPRTTLKTTLFS